MSDQRIIYNFRAEIQETGRRTEVTRRSAVVNRLCDVVPLKILLSFTFNQAHSNLHQ